MRLNAKYMLLVDFETKSLLDLGQAGSYNYADPAVTEVLCMAWQCSGIERGVWWPGEPIPGPVSRAISLAEDVCSHSNFDRLIWERVLGWPLMNWHDSMALAAYNGYPLGIDQIALALGIEGKDKDGRAAMLKMSKPPFPDTPALRRMTVRYCLHDVEVMDALVARCEPLTPALQRLYEAHGDINARGIAVDVASVLKIAAMLAEYAEARVKPLEDELGFKLSQVAVLLKWLNARGAGLHSLQSDELERWLDHRDEDLFEYGEYTRKVVEARLLAGMASVKKFMSMLRSTSPDGRLRGQYQFLTCRSGRMSSKGVQIHNLLRDSVHEDFFELLPNMDAIGAVLGDPFAQAAKSLRQTFIAEDGNELLIGDYAQIELRVLLWLAGEYAQLDRLAAGEDLYIELAREIFERPELNKAENDFERQVGKKGKLGCGYGIGPRAFQDMCAKEGIAVSQELSQRTVRIYRSTMLGVVSFWDYVEECYEAAFRSPGEFITLAMKANGPELSFVLAKGNLKVVLPSGRRLIYREARLDHEGLSYMGVHPKTHQWVRLRLWGSAMTGHIVQGIAACLLHEAIVRLNAKYREPCRVVLHTHDEVGTEAPIGLISLKEYADRMAEAPEWTKTAAKDLPIKVEASKGIRYKKG